MLLGLRRHLFSIHLSLLQSLLKLRAIDAVDPLASVGAAGDGRVGCSPRRRLGPPGDALGTDALADLLLGQLQFRAPVWITETLSTRDT